MILKEKGEKTNKVTQANTPNCLLSLAEACGHLNVTFSTNSHVSTKYFVVACANGQCQGLLNCSFCNEC